MVEIDQNVKINAKIVDSLYVLYFSYHDNSIYLTWCDKA